ncbi:MAG: GGDEF domain-containing protein [candidate division WOR-3 bacterium]|nr:GGDEF domain-containing protein [candidate division WOR-3 bacterium]
MASGNPCLVLVDERVLLKNFTLEKKEYLIGRSDECDFVIDGKEVSRRHARIYYEGGAFKIEDLNSTNGTFVNGKQITSAELKHGDEINIGNFTIIFDDGRGIEGIYDETQAESTGNETQRLIAEYKSLAEKIRERDIARHLKLYHEKVLKSRKKLSEQANRDRLTDLYNRQYFDKTFEHQFKLARQNLYPLSILFIDIDHFKKINDTYGHDKGDEVLRGVAHIIRALCRKDDIVARYGGEEFVILFPKMDKESAKQIAESMRRIIEEKSEEIIGLKITVSIGVETDLGKFANTQEFLKSADNALYQAKTTGRNRVAVGNG